MVKNASGNEAWRPDDNSPESAWEEIEIPNPVQPDQERGGPTEKLERDALRNEKRGRDAATPGPAQREERDDRGA